MRTTKETMVVSSRGQLPSKGLCQRVAFMVFFLILVMALDRASSEGCGRPAISQRIVGGTNATSGAWPWLCSLVYENKHICGGALISRTHVVTAAHCLLKRNMTNLRVMMGMLTLQNSGPNRQSFAVKSAIKHPIFTGDGSSGDLLMLQLNSEVTYNNYVQPICLPTQGQKFPTGKICSLAGWGYTSESVRLPYPSVLQQVEMPLINFEECDQIFRNKYKEGYDGQVHNDMLCAGYPDQRKDGCQGDSGGPLMCQVDGVWVMAGVVSWGVGCATPGVPGVYTEVSSFINWIRENSNLSTTFRDGISTTGAPENSTTGAPEPSSTTGAPGSSSTTGAPGSSTTTAKATTRVHTERSSTANPYKMAQNITLPIEDDNDATSGHTPLLPLTLLMGGTLLTAIMAIL